MQSPSGSSLVIDLYSPPTSPSPPPRPSTPPPRPSPSADPVRFPPPANLWLRIAHYRDNPPPRPSAPPPRTPLSVKRATLTSGAIAKSQTGSLFEQIAALQASRLGRVAPPPMTTVTLPPKVGGEGPAPRPFVSGRGFWCLVCGAHLGYGRSAAKRHVGRHVKEVGKKGTGRKRKRRDALKSFMEEVRGTERD